MKLLALRDVIVTGLAADPRLQNARVVGHGGKFDDVDLKAYAELAPCVLVAILRDTIEQQGDALQATVTFVAVCVTKNEPGPVRSPDNPAIPQYRRDANVLKLADAVQRSLAFSGWYEDLDGISLPQHITGQNYYGPKIDAHGIAMWGIGWTQTVDLTDDPGEVDAFGLLHVEYDIAPRDNDADLGSVVEAEDDIDLDP